jgi:hypothetical protein
VHLLSWARRSSAEPSAPLPPPVERRDRRTYSGADGHKRARQSWVESQAHAVDWSRILIDQDPLVRNLFGIYRS